MKIRLILLVGGLLLTLSNTHAQTTTDAGQYFNSFDNTKIYYQVHGEGKPVVLVHGFTGSSASWASGALLNDLVDAGFQVVTLDLRGNGKSDKPHELKAYENDAEAKDIMALTKKLGLTSYSVVGYSRGSIITARLLVKDKKVDCAVLGGMGSDFTNPDWPRRIMFYEALSGKDIPELKPAVESMKARGLDIPSLALQQQAQPSTSPKALAKVKVPVMVISGSEDADNGNAGELAQMIPGAVKVEVPGNHDSTVRSKPFAEAVTSFLNKYKAQH